jgi:hypothetical protein
LQQHGSLLGLEPVDHVAARQGMGRIRSARAHTRPGRSFRLHSEDTRCATSVRHRGRPHFSVSKFSRHSNCALAVQSAAQGEHPPGRDRAARRIADCRSPSHVCRGQRGSCSARLVRNPDQCLVWRPARPGFDPSQRKRPVCGWRLLVVTTKRQG